MPLFLNFLCGVAFMRFLRRTDYLVLEWLCQSPAVVHYKRMEVLESNPLNFNFLPVYSLCLGFFCCCGCLLLSLTVSYSRRLSATLLYRKLKFTVLGGHLALANLRTTNGEGFSFVLSKVSRGNGTRLMQLQHGNTVLREMQNQRVVREPSSGLLWNTQPRKIKIK